MNTKSIIFNSGAVLRRLRLEKDVKQPEVAEAMCIGVSTYSNKETGLTELNLTEVCLVAAFYGLKPSELVALIEEPGRANKTELLKLHVEQLSAENMVLRQRIERLQESLMSKV